MSQKTLARTMGFDPSYVSHLEAGRHQPSEDFVRRAELVLEANGQLWRAWRTSPRRQSGDNPESAMSAGPGAVVVEADEAELRYADGIYHPFQRRRILNTGTEPVTRYLIRISADRHPADPELSNQLYRKRPLSWEDLNLRASCDGEPMVWMPKQDRDAFKEVWLCFENDRSRFPLYPGQRVTLEYDYQVDDARWGRWFQRAVRLPTRHLSVRLVLPAELRPVVWGTETSTTAESKALSTPIERPEPGVFVWAVTDPPMGTRYRLEWRFDAVRPEHQRPRQPPSALMRSIGIAQFGEPALREPARPFDLPAQSEEARELIRTLLAKITAAKQRHVFSKGCGLAAPQLGIDRAAAVVVPAEQDAEPVVLLNPVVIGESADSDEQYEGCLSFFDVRGLVPRPLRLEVAHRTLDGAPVITAFERGLGRMVAHEIDHLAGVVYTERMRPGVIPIPVAEYRGTGHPWNYAG